MARALLLTPARALDGAMEIMLPIRSNIPDYGPPGWHLHPPMAFTARFGPRPGQQGGLDQGVIFPPGDVPPPAGPVAGPLGAGAGGCVNPQGSTFVTNPERTASQDVVEVSARIARPFVVTHITVNEFAGIDDDDNVFVFVSPDNDTTFTIPSALGTSVIQGPAGIGSIRASLRHVQSFPNFVVAQAGWYIKHLTRATATVGTRRSHIVTDYVYL